MTEFESVLKQLKSMADTAAVEGMARYGINPKNSLGISVYKLRKIAKDIGKDHKLALKMWDSGIHDMRLLACFVDDPLHVTSDQMDLWVLDFDSWDICDQACTSLFDLTPYAWEKVFKWACYDEEFVRRAAFALIAGLTVHDKKTNDKEFEKFFPLLIKYSIDERNYVKKAVNWALRNIGKRSLYLNKKAIEISKQIKKIESKSARWISGDALRKLTSEKVKNRLIEKEKKRK